VKSGACFDDKLLRVVSRFEQREKIQSREGFMNIRVNTMASPSMASRYRGCLLGGAVGDALGMPTENMTRSQILAKYGQNIDGYHPKPNRQLKKGQWTDDTVLALATVESMVKIRAFSPSSVATSMGRAFNKERWRGFGTTTKTALTRINKGYHWNESGVSGNYSSGNGAAMRAAPLALFSYGDTEQLRQICSMAFNITHRNQEAVDGGLAIAFIISRILDGSFDDRRIIEDTMSYVGDSVISDALANVDNLLNGNADTETAAAEIGTSGLVVDTVGISIFIFLKSMHSFRDAVATSASIGGDTDTIASIVGSMSGAYLGEESIPDRWLIGLEQVKKIRGLADSLYAVSHPTGGMWKYSK
jgi:ADP-ribosyl-[dinitrogen reductase] hydrolase